VHALAARLNLPPRLAWAAVILLAAAALMWTALLAHRPSIFYDSESYHLQGGRLAQHLHLIGAADVRVLDNFETPEQRAVNDTLMGARSPFYGIFFYFSVKLGGIWLTAFLQCLAAAWTASVLLRAAAPRAGPLAYGAAMALTAAVTGLPFFASFVMPDVFAGLGLLAAIGLMIYWDRLDRIGRIGLWLVVLAAGLFHTSNVLTLGLMAAAGVLLLAAGRSGWRPALLRGGVVMGAVAAAVIACQGFLVLHKATTGETLRRPPFLAVRLLADGPGRAYLRHACADASPYELCRFKALELNDTEQMLWSEDPAKGILNTSTRAQRIRMEDEEGRFVRGVVAYDPLGVAGAMLGNWMAQLRAAYVEEPIRDPSFIFGHNYFSRTSLPGMIPNNRDCRPGGVGCKPPFSLRGLIWLHQGALMLSLGFLAWRLTRPDGVATLGERPRLLDSDLGRLALLLVLVVVALLANAAVCGALSGAFPRYQARVIWLATLAAAIAAAQLGLAPDMKAVWRRLPAFARPAAG